VEDRLAGYRTALAEAGVPADAGLVVRAEASIEAAVGATRELLARRPSVSALFVYNDFMAVGVLSALLDMGRRVPDDVAIVGFDDIIYAPYLRVPLTTVSQQTEAIGRTAARLLLARMDDPGRPPERVVLDPHLVVRASTMGPR
jgi:LacI family transcriptional regulator